MDAFDADAIIYAAVPDHPLGRRVLALFSQADRQPAGAGSVLLLPEVLSRPLRDGGATEVLILAGLLARLDLRPVDKYGLRAADATHLATAIGVGADRFITSNRRDFGAVITELRVTYPADLPEARAE
jgi:predicted nucleic acid-binding protein